MTFYLKIDSFHSIYLNGEDPIPFYGTFIKFLNMDVPFKKVSIFWKFLKLKKYYLRKF
jgi:hypothetical protein